ncbi:branched-chain amino acid aminotransferase [Parashewanella curva]|uniref:Branched-chain-amino-acid aminotransferase n=1 Tax=Parashewanella curva TaxID=2338552 RepID=A0A3L8PZ54_9GAMM|nr:branched-chain amino acid aminotransferase [Parashewanella curva]RLV60585.1 branched-chain amino acid aminotransferase [Parashewanella curva]
MKIDYQLKPQSERRSTPFTPEENVGFGVLRTDHMFLMDYENGEWSNARIVPYGAMDMMPGAMCIHYGQSIFEGAKAFQHEDGEIYTYRIDKNAKRLNRSGDIVCIPNLDESIQDQAVHALIDVERLWFPQQEGACFYIRPFIFATEDRLSLGISNKYTFCVMLSPSGAYYANGFNNALRLLISKTYHRAVSGGTGASKAAGNYAASLRATQSAAEHGAAQVLYLDSTNTKLEEVGAMNHFHVRKDGTIVIPEFTDTILKSITSESILALGDVLECEVRQETILLDDFIADIESGEIIEAGGFGTAAVVSPVGSYVFEDGREVIVGDGEVGPHIKRIYTVYTDIQNGLREAPEGWLRKVERHHK